MCFCAPGCVFVFMCVCVMLFSKKMTQAHTER